MRSTVSKNVTDRFLFFWGGGRSSRNQHRFTIWEIAASGTAAVLQLDLRCSSQTCHHPSQWMFCVEGVNYVSRWLLFARCIDFCPWMCASPLTSSIATFIGAARSFYGSMSGSLAVVRCHWFSLSTGSIAARWFHVPACQVEKNASAPANNKNDSLGLLKQVNLVQVDYLLINSDKGIVKVK